MKKIFISLLFVSIMLTGCNNDLSVDSLSEGSAEAISEEGALEEGVPEENPFDLSREASESQIVSQEGFGPMRSLTEDGPINFEYNGGEVVVDYFLDNGNDKALEYGFFVFLEGIPQPFKTEAVGSEYRYCQTINLEAKEFKEFQIIFTPSQGNKGDELTVYICGMYQPSFIPDASNINFGFNHGITATAPNKLIFLEDLSNTEKENLMGEELLSNVSYIEEEITTAVREQYAKEDGNRLDIEIITELYEEDNYEQFNNVRIMAVEKENVDLIFKGMGKEGTAYRTTFYLDHHPIAIKGEDYLEWRTVRGSMAVYKMGLDVSRLEGNHILYSISIPIEGEDFYLKTESMLLIREEELPEENVTEAEKEPSENSSEINQETTAGGYVESNSQYGTIDNTDIQGSNPFVGINNREKSIFGAGDGKIFVKSDKLYIFDVYNQKIVAETPLNGFVPPESYSVTENGYCVTGSEIRDSQRYLKAVYYDKELNLIQQLDLNELTSKAPRMAAITKSGQKIAYATEQEIVLYDLNTGTMQSLLNLSAENIATLIDIKFFDNDNKLAFMGTNFAENGIDQPVFGYVPVTGSGTVTEKAGLPQLQNMAVSDDCVAFSEGIYPVGTGEPVGQVIIIDSSTGQIRRHNLLEKSEGSNIFLSDKGNYFMSCQNKGGKIIFRVYDSKTGEMIQEMSQDIGASSEQYVKTQIAIFDDSRTFIALSAFNNTDPVMAIDKF